MKFGKFMSYQKIKNSIKIFCKTETLKLVPGPAVFAKNSAQPQQATYNM